MTKFGYSYPAGCSGPPSQDDGVTDLQEKILVLLEEAGIDTATNDAVMNLVAQGEAKLAPAALFPAPSPQSGKTQKSDARAAAERVVLAVRGSWDAPGFEACVESEMRAQQEGQK